MIIRSLLAWTLIAVIPLTAAEAPPKTKTKGDEPARPIAHMVLEQKLLCKEDFSKGMPPQMWTSTVGAWSVADGILNGAERAQDHHAGVMNINVTDLPSACVIRFRFRIGDMSAAEMMGQGKIDGHPRATFVLYIKPNGIQFAAMADKYDPLDKTTRWFAALTQTFDRQTWYQMTLELNGDEALAWTDDQHVLYARDPVFLKPRFGASLRVHGIDKTGSYDDVMLTGGVVEPGWEKLRPQYEERAAKTKTNK